jgi:hypothetical protein
MGGRVLGLAELFNPRPLMVVNVVTPIPQLNQRPPSTVFYGQPLGGFPADDVTAWVAWMKSLVGQRALYKQLRLRTDSDFIAEEDLQQGKPPHISWVTVAQEELVMLKGGHDPLAGYYMQFAGQVHLFSQPRWWEDEEIF